MALKKREFTPESGTVDTYVMSTCRGDDYAVDLHTCQPREEFWRDKRGATERSELSSEGCSGGPPPEN